MSGRRRADRRGNAGKTVLLSTVPKQAPKAVDRGLLIVRANDELVLVVRNVPVVSAPLSQVLGPACQRLTFTAHADRVTAEFVGLTQGPNSEHPGSPLRGEERLRLPAADRRRLHRSQRADPARAELLGDRRHPLQQQPHPAEDGGDDPGAGADRRLLVALHRLDTADGTRHRRFLPARWWSIGALDALVIAVLVWWHFVGANTSDDGYILTMARVSEHAGYMANYYRWFGTPEARSAGTTTCWRCGPT